MNKLISKNISYLARFSLVGSFLLSGIAPVAWADASGLTVAGNYSSSKIGDGNINSLTLTLNNATGQSISDIALVASIDNTLTTQFADPINFSTTCSGGSYSFDASTFSVSDYTLPKDQTCQFTFDLKASLDGGALTVVGLTVSGLNSSAGAGTNPAGPMQYSVDPSYITASMTILNDKLSVGSVNTISVDLANMPLWFASLYRAPSGNINLADNVSLASPINFSSTCGASFLNTNASGSNTFSIPSGNPDSAACSFSFDVVAIEAGVKNIISDELTDPVASQTIGKMSSSYQSELSFINATFKPISIVPGETGVIEVSILNTDRNYAATDITFINDLNAALAGLVSTGDQVDVCGDGSSLTGTGTVNFSGGSLASEANCKFNINVSVPSSAAPGSYINTISAISYQLDGNLQTPSNAVSSFNVNSAPSISLVTKQSGSSVTSVAAGEAISVEYTLTNVDAVNAAIDVSFVHELTGLAYFTTTAPADGFCNASGTASFSASVNPPPPSSFVDAKSTFSAITLAAGDSCTFTLDYIVPDDFVAGSYQFSTAAISATVNGNGVESAAPSASTVFSVDSAPKLSFSYGPAAIGQSGFTSLDFKLVHAAGSVSDATDIGFSIDLATVLPNVLVDSLPAQPCGDGSAIIGSTTLTMSGGDLGVAESCEFSIPITVPADAVAGAYTFTSSVVDATVNGNSLTSPAATSDLQITNVTFSKSFDSDSLRIGNAASTTKVVYVINNADPVESISSIFFTEAYSTIYSGVTVASATQTDVCGTGSSATISGNQLMLIGGVLDPLSSCSFEISLNLPANMPANTYTSSTSSINGVVDSINTSFESISSQFTVNEITALTSVDVSSPTSESTILLSIEFSDDVENFEVADIVTTNSTLSNFSVVSATEYTVEVTPTAEGTVTLNVPAGVADDVLDANVTNTAAVEVSFEYQSAPLTPTPSITLGNPSVLLAKEGPVTFDVDYVDAEQVNLLADNVTLNVTGDANADITVLNGDMTSAQVSLTNLTGEGTIGISLASGTARYSTNQAPAAGPSGVFAVDTNAPSVTLSGPIGIQLADFVVDIAFSESVLGFEQSDINVSNGVIQSFSVTDSQNYVLTISADGALDVSINIAADAAQDTAGNSNIASNELVVAFDNQQPNVTVSGPDGTTSTTFSVDIGFSEAVSDFDLTDINVTNATLGSFTITDALNYSVVVKPTAQGEVSIDIAENVAMDSAGNGNIAAEQYSVIYDFNDVPVISGGPSTSVSEDETYSFVPTYSDADIADVLTFTIANKPSWAGFSTLNGTLSGTPTNDDVGVDSGILITVMDSAGASASLPAFDIEVVNVNDAPRFISEPVIEIVAELEYRYQVEVEDVDNNAAITFALIQGPEWLTVSEQGLVEGVAPAAAIGESFVIIIAADDGEVAEPVTQQYSLRVAAPDETNIAANFYFNPSPVSANQNVNLVIELQNDGLSLVRGLNLNITLSAGLNLATIPQGCVAEDSAIDCTVEDIEVGNDLNLIVVLEVEEEERGFASASLAIAAENLSEIVSIDAQVLIANLLSVVPGKLLSSTPVEHGTAFDINADNNVDLITFNSVENQLEIRLNDGMGALNLTKTIGIESSVTSVVVGDVNADGNADIVTTGGANQNSYVYLLDGDQGLLSGVVLDDISAERILLVDLKSDGQVNTILWGQYQSEIAIYSNVGTDSMSVELVNVFGLVSNSVSSVLASQAELLTEPVVQNELSPNKITSVNAIESNGVMALLVASETSKPVLADLSSDNWQARVLTSIPDSATKIITADVDGSGEVDGFVLDDNGWSLILGITGEQPQTSNVRFPQADNVIVADIFSHSSKDILFVTSKGVSIWHYYSLNDIRVNDSVIVGEDIRNVVLLDADSDGDLDLVTMDAQQAVALWYLASDDVFGQQDVDVSIFAQAPSFPQLEQAGPVEFVVVNNSFGLASNVELNVIADGGITLSQLAPGCQSNSNGMSCALGDIEPNNQRIVTVWVTASNAGTFALTGSLSLTQADTNAQNDSVMIQLVVPSKPEKESSSGSLSWAILLILSLLMVYRYKSIKLTRNC